MLLALVSASAVFAGDAVHDAICSHEVSRVKTLVNRANVNRVTGNVYPLELASYCYGGAPAVANYLLDIGADVNLHKDGYSALMWALRAYSGNEAFRPVIIRMIEKGADLKIVDATTGRTPLMGAAGAGDAELVRMMLSKGADRNARTTGDWCISGQTTQCTAADQARLGALSNSRSNSRAKMQQHTATASVPPLSRAMRSSCKNASPLVRMSTCAKNFRC